MADSTAPLLAPPAEAAAAAPAPRPRAPRQAAGTMDALRGLLPAGDDAAPLAIVAAMWANQAASAATVAARWASGGNNSRAVVVAEQASYAAFVAMALLLPPACQRLAHRFNAAHAAPPPARQARRERRAFPARIGLDRDGRLTPGPVLAILFCCMLMVGHWLVPAKVSAGLGDLGTVLASVTLCSVILPNLAIILMRAPVAN